MDGGNNIGLITKQENGKKQIVFDKKQTEKDKAMKLLNVKERQNDKE